MASRRGVEEDRVAGGTTVELGRERVWICGGLVEDGDGGVGAKESPRGMRYRSSEQIQGMYISVEEVPERQAGSQRAQMVERLRESVRPGRTSSADTA